MQRTTTGILLAFAKLVRLRPAAVIGFGGYPSVPVMLAAVIARLPTAIIEQNAVVGRANRLVMNHVRRVAAAFPIARFAPKDTSKIVLTGNPLRPDVIALWGAAYDTPSADGAEIIDRLERFNCKSKLRQIAPARAASACSGKTARRIAQPLVGV